MGNVYRLRATNVSRNHAPDGFSIGVPAALGRKLIGRYFELSVDETGLHYRLTDGPAGYVPAWVKEVEKENI